MVLGRAMTDADTSSLKAALHEIDNARAVSLATTIGSNNDRLWREMTNLGWMTAGDSPDLPAGTRAFRIKPDAKSAIADFLSKCLHCSNDQSHQ
jgi:hypothetical protein